MNTGVGWIIDDHPKSFKRDLVTQLSQECHNRRFFAPVKIFIALSDVLGKNKTCFFDRIFKLVAWIYIKRGKYF